MVNLIALFFVAFFLNLLYELLHSLLYTTCHKATLPAFIYLMLKGALFDGVAIAVIYAATFFIFPKYYQLAAFILVCLLFAWAWERYSLRTGKWEYRSDMPVILGAGLTPLVQLAATGTVAICIIATSLI